MNGARRPIAIVCIAAVVLAAFMPLLGAGVVYADFVPLWLVAPDLRFLVACDATAINAEQPVALLAHVPSRAPPAILA